MEKLANPLNKKMASLSPCRQALADHQIQQAATTAAVAAARISVQKIQAVIETAQANLRTAEGARHSLIELEATGIRESCGLGGAPDLGLQLAAAEAEVARAQRVVTALEHELVTVEAPLRGAQLTAGLLNSATEKLVADIVRDEAHDAIAKMAAAGVAAARAEAHALSAVESIAGKRLFLIADQLNEAISKMPRPGWSEVTQGPAAWNHFVDALALDAGAEAPGGGHA